jgi:hypothetical protein
MKKGIEVMLDNGQPSASKQEYLVAVGLPKGIIHDTATDESVGLIRLGGRVVDTISSPFYEAWTHYLIPRSMEEVTDPRSDQHQGHQSLLDELLDRGCLVNMQVGAGLASHLTDLKPLPLGCGVGNKPGYLETFVIDAPGGDSVAVDPVGQALWVAMDGNQTLSQILSETSAWFSIDPTILENALIYTLLMLMAKHCLYLDRAV